MNLDEACYHPVLAEFCKALAEWVRGRPDEEFGESQESLARIFDVRRSRFAEPEAKYAEIPPVQALCEVASDLVWHARRVRRFATSLFSVAVEERIAGLLTHLGEHGALVEYVQVQAIAALKTTVAAGAPFAEADLRIKTVVQLCHEWLRWGIAGIRSEPPAEGEMSKEETDLARGLVEAVAALQRLGLAFGISRAQAALLAPDGKEADETGTHDREFMELAIEAARKSAREDDRVHPKVGAVIVKDGNVLAVAHRGELQQGDHAEYTALEKKLCDATLAGATVYTTLEPCTTRNHPKVPCAIRLIERKVRRVVIGMLDPNPTISGKGVKLLREHNIAVDFFSEDLMAILEELNRDFIRAHSKTAATQPGTNRRQKRGRRN